MDRHQNQTSRHRSKTTHRTANTSNPPRISKLHHHEKRILEINHAFPSLCSKKQRMVPSRTAHHPKGMGNDSRKPRTSLQQQCYQLFHTNCQRTIKNTYSTIILRNQLSITVHVTNKILIRWHGTNGLIRTYEILQRSIFHTNHNLSPIYTPRYSQK